MTPRRTLALLALPIVALAACGTKALAAPVTPGAVAVTAASITVPPTNVAPTPAPQQPEATTAAALPTATPTTSPAPPTTVDQMASLRRWYLATGESNLTKAAGLLGDFGEEATGNQSLAKMARITGQLGTVWDEMYQSVPTDTEAGQAAQDAYAACSAASHDLHDAIVTVDVAALNVGADEMDTCAAQLQTATATFKIQLING